MALPSHWQLQGHDIPIYTNTAYPFAFDPPRARRTGMYTKPFNTYTSFQQILSTHTHQTHILFFYLHLDLMIFLLIVTQ